MNTTRIPTYARRLTLSVDPLEVFAALTDDGTAEGCVLFETAETLGGSRRSLLLTAPALTLRIGASSARIEGPLEAVTAVTKSLLAFEMAPVASGVQLVFPPRLASDEPRVDAPAFTVLRAFATSFSPSRPDLDVYALGAFTFDLIDHVESLPSLARTSDDVVFRLPRELLVVDHDASTLTVIEYDFEGRGEFACGKRIEEVLELIGDAGVHAPIAIESVADPTAVATDIDDVDFGGMVETARRHIVDGEVFQVVLSREFRTACSDPMGAYRALRAMNPSPYMFYFGGESVLFGASPETSLRVTDDLVEIRPIAGTRRRGRGADGALDHDLDTRVEAELRLDQKEVAEHMMLVDLARNDVARVSRAGTRRVDRLMGVDRYSTVMHLVSHVSGRMRPEYDALHAYAAAMNMGTLTGAPKIRATEILRELEGRPRGFYGGAVGYLTHRGDFDTAIVIRSAEVHDGVATVRAGAGIVHDSDPAAEADETRRKACSVLHAIAASRRQGAR